jgi:predicted HNH restriction endonuclease
LVFQGLEEALAQCGYEVRNSIRAGGRGTPIAMMVRFASTPSLPEWRSVEDAQDVIRLAEEVPAGAPYSEGSVQRVLVNRYERDPRARQECIQYYGTKCFLCGFDFVAKYGEVMAGFIHVHHLVSLSSVGEEYEVDPSEDLRPVCPNCHAVLHRREPPYSLEDVQRFLHRRE